MMFDVLPDSELEMWARELARVYLSGALSTASVNGVTMTFGGRSDLEARMAALDAARQRRAGAAPAGGVIESYVVRPRRGR